MSYNLESGGMSDQFVKHSCDVDLKAIPKILALRVLARH